MYVFSTASIYRNSILQQQQQISLLQQHQQPQTSAQISQRIQSQLQTQLSSQMQLQMKMLNSIQNAKSPNKPQQQQPSNSTLSPGKQHQQQLQPTKQQSTVSNNPGYKRSRQIFTVEQEEELAVFVRDTSIYYNGMSSKDVRTLAFVYGVCNQVDLPPGWRDTHQASFDWCLGFIKRNNLNSMMITSHIKTACYMPTMPSITGGNASSMASNAEPVGADQSAIEIF